MKSDDRDDDGYHMPDRILNLDGAFNRRVVSFSRRGWGPRGGVFGYTPVSASSSSSLEVPEQIPGLFAWWRADSGISLNGSNVASWTDRKNGRVLTQATASLQPLYVSSDSNLGSKEAVQYDGAGDTLVDNGAWSQWKFITDGTGMTVFVVAWTDPTAPNGTTVAGINGNPGFWMWQTGRNTHGLRLTNTSSAVYGTSIGGVPVTTGSWLYVMDEGATSRIDALGVGGSTPARSVAQTSNNPAGSMQVGFNWAGGWFKGTIAEVIVYDEAISTGSIGMLTGYVNSRYSLTQPGWKGFTASNYAATAEGVLTGSTGGFWVAALVTLPSLTTATSNPRMIGNRGTNDGYSLRFTNYVSASFAVWNTGGAAQISPLATIDPGDAGKLLMFVGVFDGTNVRCYYKRAEVGSGTAIVGTFAPAAGAGNRLELGALDGANPMDAGAILHGAAGGYGVPSLAQIQTYFDDVKAAKAMVAMTGVQTDHVWNTTVSGFVDSVGGQNANITGSLTRETDYPVKWSW